MKKLFNLYDSRLGWVALLGLILLLPGQALAGKNAFKLLDDVEIHGFASSSYTFNFNEPDSRTNNFRIFDQDANSFQFDVGELVFLKETADMDDIGFRVDLTYGFSVPEVAQSTPLTPDDEDDFDVQQGYVSWKAPVGNGLQLDFGKFITHIGAEVIEGYDGWNSNFSRSFLFGLAIPFTHTGLRASYDINDQLSVLGVIANGWDNTTDNNDSKSIGFQVAYSPSDDLAIFFNWMGGNEQTDSDHEFRQIFDIVVDAAVSNQLSLQFNLDYGTEQDTGVGGDDAEWFGLAGIVRYDVNKWFSMNFRAEIFKDYDGVRTLTTATPGHDLWEITITPEFRINKNMVVRAEYRHDESNKPVFGDGAGFSDTQDTVAFNALVYF